MNTLMITKRHSLVSSVMVLVMMALLGAMFVTTVAAAPDYSEQAMDNWITKVREDCTSMGGEASTHYEFNAEGGVDLATTTCVGGDWDGRVCYDSPGLHGCHSAFVKPTESVAPEQRPDTAEEVENPEGTSPIVGEIVAPPGGVAEDPTGGDQETIANRAAADQVAACEALGGTVIVNAQFPTATADIHCTGGMLDGMICYGTICDYFAAPAGPGEDARVPPTGGIAEDQTGTTTIKITFVRMETVAELEDALLAENPTGSDTVVVYNQSGPTVDEIATDFVLACEAVGGTVRVTEDRTAGSGLKSIFVRCTGGLLGGLGCGYLPSGYSACFFRTVLPEDAQVTPVGGIEAPAGVPTQTPTVAPTVVSVVPTAPPPTPSPTVVPTIELVEATAAPTKSLPDPKNDNAVPPGNEAKDPSQNEPAPTEAPLR